MGLHSRCVSLLLMASGGVSIHAHWAGLTHQQDMLRKVTDETIGAPWSGLVAAEGANPLATLGHALVAPSLAMCAVTGAFLLAWSRAFVRAKAIGDFWLVLTVATALAGFLARLGAGDGAGLIAGTTALGVCLSLHGGIRNIGALRLLVIQTLVLMTLPGFAFSGCLCGAASGAVVWLASILHTRAIGLACARSLQHAATIPRLPTPEPRSGFWDQLQRRAK
jgi:hypothetical protein